MSDGPSSFPDDLNWRIRIDLRTGNLQVLRLCRYYHNPIAVGWDKVVICVGCFSRAKQIYNPLSTAAVLCGQKQMTEDLKREHILPCLMKSSSLRISFRTLKLPWLQSGHTRRPSFIQDVQGK
ncbi:uncharacterized protein LOC125475004 isoform X1 [Pyrus x bretschneideri]|uniref:uncharacterized protein LOC125475004 isoform X1 n=1 Tax=Pyrus x bretschneideri TaxID=225117 RepID=UPI00202F6307|nr:uncharacterized protein LOC125475004 isoform X1 [Pyrus x bretschneideri]XP_048435275.1 uncharacterized protein LOC125475004 isoform X1 [Pyrus x bretschneideri]XP_048435276.1 uncharacterized protein LOC125475004 isoform X1 [Pyrus x bretschneideri]XP_048435278.1 uncharacterized protein LOC125475004 isoform X3 [Pyrus x bretschneideri]XP_048435280.1 uncharacterized protein LOC125475004 isoform X1 [Pyrus x bretschneideri]